MNHSYFKASLQLFALFAVEVGSLVALLDLGKLSFLSGPGPHPANWGPWLAQSAPADAVASLARLIALGSLLWLVGSTVIYLIARAAQAPKLLRAAHWGTPAALRRLVDQVLAISVAASLLGGSATAAFATSPPPPPVMVSATGSPGVILRVIPEPSPPPASPPATPRPATPRPPVPALMAPIPAPAQG
ncbi:MAG: hypothetical protein ACRDJU_02455, partial [Actinomycetota bacterium]